MTFSLTWLPEVLERAGLRVAETADWRTRGRGEMGPVRGVMCHHTGTIAGGNMPTLDLLIRGRSDLAGPLCQLALGRDGTFYVVAAGRANHAGPGRWEGIETGNSSFIGIEAENGGRPQDLWPDVQIDAYQRGVAAILAHIGAPATLCCGHKEWAPGRKNDPLFDMAGFRAKVQLLLSGRTPPPPIAAVDDRNRPTLRRGMRGDTVRDLQKALGLELDGIFGGATEAAVRAWQRRHGLVPDGIVGPRAWEVLDQPVADTQAMLAVVQQAPVDPSPPASQVDLVDLPFLKVAFPESLPAELARWVEPMQRACRRFGIDTDREICSFLANIGVESGGLTRLSESLNYSVQGLLGTFGRHRISEADARRLGRKSGERSLPLARQEELANLLYGGDWGRTNLGNTEPGDGWRFRGYGPKQLTGRGNCSRFADAVQLPLAQIPDFLRTPDGGCLGAGWFWQAHGLDRYAATPGLGDDRRAINGGELGLAEVEQRFDRLMAEMARRRASAPASAPAAP
ncbi:N-acetylmuramoyl-L-alanine amidase [Sphingomonas sp. R1]|uniref:N-acetylmuramoyl-L-alanine amidase n=1 Tax=Sphingomonas sp. R1 TaxID=399176 RepID=UPI0022256857|nr:N-acetylmuramoyl-L-alanine amidase [Sphingomonas sp. R1]UYY76639.1 N-acetylmuramoyl-L-alanine amidase [Sphingomonas sp. R1]